MRPVSLSVAAKVLRRPWYLFWQLIENLFYRKREYTLSVPFGHRIYTPWFDTDSEFTRIINKVRALGPMAVSPDRCYILYQWARRSVTLPGDLAECGVYTGGTAHLVASVLAAHTPNSVPTRFHLFDTFSGMPDTAIPQRDYHTAGDFSDTSLEFVKKRLQDFASCCVFHPGLMPDTFVEVENVSKYSFVHVDVDIYPSVMVCCEWFWPRLVSGGAMIFDDYGFYPYRHAARAAVDEFFSDKIELPIVLPTGQAVVIKN